MNYKIYELKNFGDKRGALIPLEYNNNLPFELKRAFYIFDTKPSTPRGAHANKNSEFVLIMLTGSCKILIDDGQKKETIELNSPNQALYLGKMLWKEMYDFSYNSIMLVLSNHIYNEEEYIRNYEDFITTINS